jgi:transposase-like protein
MEKSGKRGKIPQSDWPLIMIRYEQGETLSSIARTYDCSPPAISYIVNRSREKPTGEPAAPSTAEPQLVKTSSNGAAADGSVPVEPTEPAPPMAMAALRREVPAAPRSPETMNGGSTNGGGAEQRGRLHLSLGNGHNRAPPNGNGHAQEQPETLAERPTQSREGADGQRPPEVARNAPLAAPDRDGRDLFALAQPKPPQQPRDREAPPKENGAFIDRELRNRVDGDIAAFLAAFDAALAADTQESRFGLREATDRLLRAGARTRIELERLEARVPLSPREGRTGSEPAWRYR